MDDIVLGPDEKGMVGHPSKDGAKPIAGILERANELLQDSKVFCRESVGRRRGRPYVGWIFGEPINGKLKVSAILLYANGDTEELAYHTEMEIWKDVSDVCESQ